METKMTLASTGAQRDEMLDTSQLQIGLGIYWHFKGRREVEATAGVTHM
jgi:hypothetical protein